MKLWDHEGYNHHSRGVLFFKKKIYLAADSDLCQAIAGQFHNGTHEGYQKTLQQICNNFYWKGMRQYIRVFIKNCDICQQHKVQNLAPAGLLHPSPIPNEVWEDISMD